MTRQETNIMKGVAILLMIFYHLFNASENHLYVNTWLGQIALRQNPVPFYLILSGYGMYFVTNRGGQDRHRWSRLLKLYLRYWCITAAFVSISYLTGSFEPDLSPLSILQNVTAFSTTYNNVAWFILPYAMLALSAPFLFRAMDRVGILPSLAIAYAVYCGAAYMNRYSWFGANVFQYFYLLFPFLLGGVMCKTCLLEMIRNKFQSFDSHIYWLLLALLVAARYFVGTGAVMAVYAFGFTLLLLLARRPSWLDSMLQHLGRHSTSMWLIHIYYVLYLTHDLLYGLGNPLLIMAVAVMATYITARLFDAVFKKLDI